MRSEGKARVIDKELFNNIINIDRLMILLYSIERVLDCHIIKEGFLC